MKHWKSILLLVLVFLTGIVAGVAGSRAMARLIAAKATDHPEWAQMVIERSLNRRLGLDENQKAQLHDIMTDARGQITTLRGEYRPKIEVIYLQTDSQIQGMLKPEQLERYKKIREQEHPMLRSLRLTP